MKTKNQNKIKILYKKFQKINYKTNLKKIEKI